MQLNFSGIDVVNRVVSRLSDGETSSDWPSVLVEVTTSEIKTIDCVVSDTSMYCFSCSRSFE